MYQMMLKSGIKISSLDKKVLIGKLGKVSKKESAEFSALFKTHPPKKIKITWSKNHF